MIYFHYTCDMSTLAERLNQVLMDNPSLTKTGLWKACDLTSGAISQWFSGQTKEIKGASLLKDAVYLGVNPEWLASGKGDPVNKNTKHLADEVKQDAAQYIVGNLKIPTKEQMLIDAFRGINEESQMSVIEYVQYLYQKENPEDGKGNPFKKSKGKVK